MRRRYTVGTNLGDEPESTPVKCGGSEVYPDLVMVTSEAPRRLHGVIEVETAESVNHLEAMAEWVHFAKARGAFYLYVPAGTTDVALRLCSNYKIAVSEIWSYYAVGEQMRFTMTYRSARAAAAAQASKAARLAQGAPKRKSAAKKAPARKSATKGGAKRAAKKAPAKKGVAKRTVAVVRKKTAKKATAKKKAASKNRVAIKKKAVRKK